MKASIATASLWLILWASAAWSQGHNFESIRSSTGPASTTAGIPGFRPKVVDLNNSIVGDDTSRTRLRDEQRRSSGTAPSPATSDRFVCPFLCRGSLYATGNRHEFMAYGGSESEARESIKGKANGVCQTEGRGRGGAWWADQSICRKP